MPFPRKIPCERHTYSPNYCETIYCDTPYCEGREYYCLECHWYIAECGCMSQSGEYVRDWFNVLGVVKEDFVREGAVKCSARKERDDE